MIMDVSLSATEHFTVKTEAFEGPLELLLFLIEKRKLHISDISLASVTDDFIAYIDAQQQFPISQAANFILVASTLLLIKSKALLPTLSLSEEEEHSIDDLELQLKLYKRMRELSKQVASRFGVAIMFGKSPSRSVEPIFSPDKWVTLPTLALSIREVIRNLPRKQLVPKTVVKKIVSLEEMIEKLSLRVAENLQLSFREFAGIGKTQKTAIIVSFLALLELVKRNAISVSQNDSFSDIIIESGAVSVPKYH
jgi:segregation and condensation protein A